MDTVNGNIAYLNANQNNGISNINSLYPSLYRILMPVVQRVVQNSNLQFLNEDVLNNITDTIYNIVEGQIEYGDNPQNRSQDTRNENSQNNNARNNTSKSNELLIRDIIKILVLREIVARNMYQMQMNNMQLFNMNY